jgi:hypothetical protein
LLPWSRFAELATDSCGHGQGRGLRGRRCADRACRRLRLVVAGRGAGPAGVPVRRRPVRRRPAPRDRHRCGEWGGGGARERRRLVRRDRPRRWTRAHDPHRGRVLGDAAPSRLGRGQPGRACRGARGGRNRRTERRRGVAGPVRPPGHQAHCGAGGLPRPAAVPAADRRSAGRASARPCARACSRSGSSCAGACRTCRPAFRNARPDPARRAAVGARARSRGLAARRACGEGAHGGRARAWHGGSAFDRADEAGGEEGGPRARGLGGRVRCAAAPRNSGPGAGQARALGSAGRAAGGTPSERRPGRDGSPRGGAQPRLRGRRLRLRRRRLDSRDSGGQRRSRSRRPTSTSRPQRAAQARSYHCRRCAST